MTILKVNLDQRVSEFDVKEFYLLKAEFDKAYDQGRKDAIDEVLELLKSNDASYECEDMCNIGHALWLEKKLNINQENKT